VGRDMAGGWSQDKCLCFLPQRLAPQALFSRRFAAEPVDMPSYSGLGKDRDIHGQNQKNYLTLKPFAAKVASSRDLKFDLLS